MNRMKRTVAWLLVVVMLVSLISCAQEPSEPKETAEKTHPIAETTKPKEEEPKAPPIDDSMANYWVDLVVDGAPQYTIVSEAAEYDAAAKLLAAGLQKNTGVAFPVKSYGQKATGVDKKISVGANPEVILNYVDGGTLTYAGCLSVTPDEGKTIYLTGYHESAVLDTVQRFVSGVLLNYRQTDEQGKIQVKAPDIRLFFLYNPDNYAKTNATLLGVDLSEYVIVAPYDLNAVEELTVRLLIQEIGTNTGDVIRRVTDKKSKAEHEIVLGATSRAESQALYTGLEDQHYALKSVDGSLYAAYDSYLAMGDVRKVINALCLSDQPSINLVQKQSYEAPYLQKEDDGYVRVMTSNIVCGADSGAKQNYDINGMTCDLRVEIQGLMIMEYLPDFVGLQEMQESTLYGVTALMRTELLEATEEEYAFVQYSNIPSAEYWNPILYRKTVWQVEEQEASAPFDTGMHRWQWALFSKINRPDEQCIVMNLHYPTSTNYDKQLLAAEIVNAQIKHLQEEYPGVPIFVTGDFNCRQDSVPYETSFAETTLVTANRSKDAIDHVMYDAMLAERIAGTFVTDSWIEKTSDHRPYFADFYL